MTSVMNLGHSHIGFEDLITGYIKDEIREQNVKESLHFYQREPHPDA